MPKGLKGRKTFVRTPHTSFLYKWTPFDDERKAKRKKAADSGCTAAPGSQGVDNNVTYVYKLINNEKRAYVACDYVE